MRMKNASAKMQSRCGFAHRIASIAAFMRCFASRGYRTRIAARTMRDNAAGRMRRAVRRRDRVARADGARRSDPSRDARGRISDEHRPHSAKASAHPASPRRLRSCLVWPPAVTRARAYLWRRRGGRSAQARPRRSGGGRRPRPIRRARPSPQAQRACGAGNGRAERKAVRRLARRRSFAARGAVETSAGYGVTRTASDGLRLGGVVLLALR